MRKTRVSPVKDMLLNRYAPLADSIAALFFPYAEVVIHDLHAQTVLYLANNLSKREIGDASTLDEIDHAAREGVVGPYEKLNWDGRRLRCVSNVLFDEQGEPAGMMCISFNIAVFEDMRGMLDLFIKGAGIVRPNDELFRDDWQDRIHAFLHGWLRERQLGLNGLTREHRRELVAALYEEGAFRGKSSADYVAAVLGMGRATVYKHLKQMKQNSG
jgi:predicted transcriptional regulator YheO